MGDPADAGHRRHLAQYQFPGTIVFAAVAGEEQGLYGSTFMAQQMAAAGNDVQGMFSNDIIGASHAHDGTRPDPFTVRMFLEGIPTTRPPKRSPSCSRSVVRTTGRRASWAGSSRRWRRSS